MDPACTHSQGTDWGFSLLGEARAVRSHKEATKKS